MVKLKSKKAVAFLGVALLLVAGIVAFVVVKKPFSSKKTTDTAKVADTPEDINKKNEEAYAKNIADLEKSRQDGLIASIKDNQVQKMFTNISTKDYAAVIAVGSTLCKQVTGNDQFYCYDFYGQALAATNDLTTYIAVANEALQSPGVKANEIAIQSWNLHLTYAKKGQNPYVITPEMDEDARR